MKVSPSRGQAGRARPGQGAGAAGAANDDDKAAALSAPLREGLTNISQVISGIAQIAQNVQISLRKICKKNSKSTDLLGRDMPSLV